MAVTDNPLRRLPSLDFLRGFAMISLVFVHSVLFLGGAAEEMDAIQLVFGYIMGDIGAALFTTLVGISFILSTESRSKPSYLSVVKSAAIRGALLIVLSMLFSVFVAGGEAAFECDILTLIGISSIAIALLRPLPNWALLVIVFVIVSVAPVLRRWLDYASWWGGNLEPIQGLPVDGILLHPAQYFEPGLDPVAGAAGLVAVGWFPVFPWLAFPIIGMVLGRFIGRNRVRISAVWTGLGCALLAVATVVLALAVRIGDTDPVSQHLTVLSFTPDSVSLFIFQAGLVMIVLGTAHLVLDRDGSPGEFLSPFLLVGRHSLTVYALSWIAIGGAIRLADVLEPGRRHYQTLTDSTWAFVFALAFLVVLVPVLARWDRSGGVGTLEWVMKSLRRGSTRQVSSRSPAAEGVQAAEVGDRGNRIWRDVVGVIVALPITFGLLAGIMAVVLLMFVLVGFLSGL